MVPLTNAQRIQVEAAAATLHPRVRESFKHAVMGALSLVAQPPDMNSVLMSIKLALQLVPVRDVLTSRTAGTTTGDDDYDDLRRRY
jgi:hypothetical protein